MAFRWRSRPKRLTFTSGLRLSLATSDAYKEALQYMVEHAQTGGVQAAGDYLVGYAIEDAEVMYVWTGGEASWRNPQAAPSLTPRLPCVTGRTAGSFPTCAREARREGAPAA